MSDRTAMKQKIAVVFAKTGPAIHHSHHDLIRFWERAVKRAGLPVRLTQGFNPRPRIIFPHALGLGVASRHEEVELELYESVPVGEILPRLKRAVGDTLEIIDAVPLPPVKKSRQILSSSYRIGGWPDSAGEALAAFAADILRRGEIRVERGAPGDRRSVDVRPYLQSVTHDPEDRALRLVLKHTPTGSGRPDEIAKLAAEAVGCDWRDVRLEKIGMVLA